MSLYSSTIIHTLCTYIETHDAQLVRATIETHTNLYK